MKQTVLYVPCQCLAAGVEYRGVLQAGAGKRWRGWHTGDRRMVQVAGSEMLSLVANSGTKAPQPIKC